MLTIILRDLEIARYLDGGDLLNLLIICSEAREQIHIGATNRKISKYIVYTSNALMEAVKTDDVVRLKFLIETFNICPGDYHAYGSDILVCAANKCKLETLKCLIERDDISIHILSFALAEAVSERGRGNIVTYLINKFLERDEYISIRATLFWHAAANGYMDYMDLFLEQHGKDAAGADRTDFYALDWAVRNKQIESSKYLVEKLNLNTYEHIHVIRRSLVYTRDHDDLEELFCYLEESLDDCIRDQYL